MSCITRFAALFALSALAGGLAACAPPERGPNAPSSSATTTSAQLPLSTDSQTMAQQGADDRVVEPAQMLRRPADEPDYHVQALANANQVLAAMNDDILGCYKKRVAVAPQAHAFLTTDILIGSDGHVVRVDTTGGALLGDATLGCIVHRIEKGAFAPSHDGGTLRVQVPFDLRQVPPDEAP